MSNANNWIRDLDITDGLKQLLIDAAQLVQSVTSQNMTGNQSSNQSVGLDLLPPRVVEEDTEAEILGGQQ